MHAKWVGQIRKDNEMSLQNTNRILLSESTAIKQ